MKCPFCKKEVEQADLGKCSVCGATVCEFCVENNIATGEPLCKVCAEGND